MCVVKLWGFARKSVKTPLYLKTQTKMIFNKGKGRKKENAKTPEPFICVPPTKRVINLERSLQPFCSKKGKLISSFPKRGKEKGENPDPIGKGPLSSSSGSSDSDEPLTIFDTPCSKRKPSTPFPNWKTQKPGRKKGKPEKSDSDESLPSSFPDSDEFLLPETPSRKIEHCILDPNSGNHRLEDLKRRQLQGKGKSGKASAPQENKTPEIIGKLDKETNTDSPLFTPSADIVTQNLAEKSILAQCADNRRFNRHWRVWTALEAQLKFDRLQ